MVDQKPLVPVMVFIVDHHSDHGSGNHEMVHSKTFCETTPYMPPEMLEQKSYSPLAADKWSLRICLHLCQYSFSDDPETMSKLQIGSYISIKPKYDGTLSADIKDLINSMLQSESNRRITMNNVLFHP